MNKVKEWFVLTGTVAVCMLVLFLIDLAICGVLYVLGLLFFPLYAGSLFRWGFTTLAVVEGTISIVCALKE